MAILTPSMEYDRIFAGCPDDVQRALGLALGLDKELFDQPDILLDPRMFMMERIAGLKASIAAGGELYEGTGELQDVDEDTWNTLKRGLKRIPRAVLDDMAYVLQIHPNREILESLSKSDVCAVIVSHVFNLNAYPQIQRFKAQYRMVSLGQQSEDIVTAPPEDIVTAQSEDIVTAPTALLPGEP
jgi:hypothetical protein